MARRKPNIVIDTALKKRDRTSFRNFVLQVIEDTYIFEYPPDDIQLLSGSAADFDNQFILYLFNHRFIIDILEVDNVEDYVDIFLYGIRQPQIRYVNGSATNDSFAEIQYISGSTIANHTTGSTWEDANGLKFIFKDEITSDQAPEDVLTDFNTPDGLVTFTIKGKITKIIEDEEIIP